MKLMTLCYIQKGNKTLMLHRVKKRDDIHEGKWNGVGGHFEKGESPEDCVIREVWEETKLRIKNPKLRGILTFPSFNKGIDGYVFVFTAKEFTGKLHQNCPEGNLEWVKTSEIMKLNLWRGDKYFLPLLNKKKFFSIRVNYEGEKIRSRKIIEY